MTQPNYEHIQPAAAKLMIEEQGAVVVDVRTVGEFEAGHIPGAHNIPIAFGTPPALTPNEAFADAVARRFPRDAKLIFV